MNSEHKGKQTRRSTMAILVISCMLACAFGPAISTLGDDESSVYADGIALNYVSLGDSMVNGCGMYDYYTQEGDNYFGFEVHVDDTYPVIVKNHLESQGFDVELNQLAISGIRSAEIRNLLDSGFVGDYYTANETDASLGAYSHILKALERYQDISGNADADLDDMRGYYEETISDADLITYQVHWDFGTTISMLVKSVVMGETYQDPVFDLYVDPAILDAVAEVRATVEEVVQYILAELDIVIDDYMGIIETADRLVETLMYIIVGYCANFDANMTKIFELNPDAKVFVLDNYSNFTGMELAVGDVTIPLDKVSDVLMDTVNLYTKYLSPYSCATYHVDIDGFVSTFSYDFIDYGEGVDEIGEDARYIMHLIFKEYGYNATMDDLACLEDTENLFFKEVFSSKTLEFSALTGLDKDAMIGKLKSVLTMFAFDCHTKALPEDQCRCVMTQDDDGITLDGYVLEGTTITPASVSFSDGELGLLQFYLAVYSMGSAIIHPSAEGHVTISDLLIEVIDDSLYEDAPSLMNDLPLGWEPPTEPAPVLPTEVGTLVGLLDYMAMGSYNVDDIADRLGLDVDDTILPPGVRVNDINYLLGGTDVLDAYGQELLYAAAAEYGVSIGEFRQMYQDAVIGSSVVVVSAGSGNITSAIAAGIAAITGGETAELDFTDVGVDPILVSAIQDIRATINEILVTIFGEGSEVVDTVETVMDVFDNVAYGIAGYMDNYGAIVEAIMALNPETKIIVLGPYNMLEGVVYDDGTIRVDIGAISGLVVKGINKYNSSQVPDIDDVIYSNMSHINAGKPEFNIAGFDMETDMEALMEHMALDIDARDSLNEAIVDVFVNYQYSITFSMGGYGDDHTTYYNFDDTIIIPEAPVAEPGCHFVGWVGPIPETVPACNMYIECLFADNAYTIIFNGNGGDGTMEDVEVLYNQYAILDTNAFTLEGYVFAGWNTAADGSGTAYADGAEVLNLCIEDGDTITLYAMWNVAPADDVFDAPRFIATASVFLVIVAFGAMLYARRN